MKMDSLEEDKEIDDSLIIENESEYIIFNFI